MAFKVDAHASHLKKASIFIDRTTETTHFFYLMGTDFSMKPAPDKPTVSLQCIKTLKDGSVVQWSQPEDGDVNVISTTLLQFNSTASVNPGKLEGEVEDLEEAEDLANLDLVGAEEVLKKRKDHVGDGTITITVTQGGSSSTSTISPYYYTSPPE